jgi:hypothetical protein
MANSLKVISWNIEKFGEDKLNDVNFIDYVTSVIRLYQADLVAIMELVGWMGNETRDALVMSLNNKEKAAKTGVVWKGEASEMTPARPNEQYLFLWKQALFTDIQFVLWNVVGDSDFSEFFVNNKFGIPQQEDFWKSMFKNGWLDASYILPYKKGRLLAADPNNLDLTTKAPMITLTPKQKQALVGVLLREDVTAFPVRGSRPPFLLKATTAAAPKTEIVFAVYHAPGPGNALPIIASNSLSYIEWVGEAAVGVLMGDFNVTAADAANTFALQFYDYDVSRIVYIKAADGVRFVTGYPFQRITGPNYKPKAGDPKFSMSLDYGKRLWADKTSLTSTLVGADTIADDTSILTVLANEYDKFFVRASKPDPSPPKVINLIDMVVPKKPKVPGAKGKTKQVTRSTTATQYQRDLADLVYQIYNEWWDRQNSKLRKKASTIKLLSDSPQLTKAPQSLFEAQYTYVYAISDHLPIYMELQYA